MNQEQFNSKEGIMERSDRIKLHLEHIKNWEAFLKINADKLEIYDGNLLPYVDAIMQKTVSKNYYDKVKDRLIPLNVLTRVIDKLSKVYASSPQRSDERYQGFIDTVKETAAVDMKLGVADSYSHLFKGYALEPYLEDKKINLRVIPFDRFLPLSLDIENPTRITDFIKFMGERVNSKGEKKPFYFSYTDEDFFAFDSSGEELTEYYEGNEGKNLFGIIPFIYGSRSLQNLIPTQDTDILQMSKMIPVLLSDLAGAIMFQCFTIIYGIDVKSENLTMSPNAFWSLKTDNKTDSKPVIGTIKPEADIDKVVGFIKSVFAFWLETKGVRIGSMNSIDAGNVASGLAKIIDEMDVYEVKKNQIQFFKIEEKKLWDLIAKMNNYWLKHAEGFKSEIIGEDFNPIITFDEPKPEISRDQMVTTVDKEYKGGYLDSLSAIRQLYPDLPEDEVIKRAEALDLVSGRKKYIDQKEGIVDEEDKEKPEGEETQEDEEEEIENKTQETEVQ